MNMEYCENHQKEYEEQQAAMEEIIAEEPTAISVEEENYALICDLRDRYSTFTPEQIESVKQIALEGPESPKDRLYVEALELKDKIDKLDAFLRKRNVDGVKIIEELKLTDAAIYLLYKQFDVMKEYYNILCARYSVFDIKKED